MKVFISKIVVFLLLVVLSVIGVVLAINSSMRNNSSFVIDKTYTNLILGHSHPECAYDDDLISHTLNFAQSGESYFYTYIKTKELIASNPHVKQVFIEFSNDQINLSKNNWIWDDDFLSEKYPKFSPFMTFEDQKVLLNGNTKGFFNTLSVSANKNFYNLINGKTDFTDRIGGFIALEHTLEISKETTSFKNPTTDSTSIVNIQYLKKLVDFCKQQQLKVYLVRSPLHKKNIDLKNEALFQKVRKEYFDDVTFLDFVSFPLNDSDFADLEHLNNDGAIKYSKWFNTQLRNGFHNISYNNIENLD